MPSDEEITAILAASLPKGEHNGLAPYARLLADFPRKVRVAMILIDCSKSTVRHSDDSQIATARIRRIELITDPADAKIMERILLRAFETRTGAVTLPFELEADVKSAFEDIDLTDADDERRDDLEAREVVAELDERREEAASKPETYTVDDSTVPLDPEFVDTTSDGPPEWVADTVNTEIDSTLSAPDDASELFSEGEDPTAGPWQ